MSKKDLEEQVLKEDLKNGWLWFEQEILYAQNYNLLPSLSSMIPGPSPKNSILEQLLPGLLYIKAMSILDQGLTAKIGDIQSELSDKLNKEDLYHRIEYLASHKYISNSSALHKLRKRRKVLAHESGWHSSWEELLEAVSTIRGCLQSLQIVGEVSKYAIYGERSKLRASEDPNAVWERTIRVYINDGENIVREISYVQKTMKNNI